MRSRRTTRLISRGVNYPYPYPYPYPYFLFFLGDFVFGALTDLASHCPYSASEISLAARPRVVITTSTSDASKVRPFNSKKAAAAMKPVRLLPSVNGWP